MISAPGERIGHLGHSQEGHLLVLSDPNFLWGNRQHGNRSSEDISNTFSKDGQEACSKSALTGPQNSRTLEEQDTHQRYQIGVHYSEMTNWVA